MSFHANIYYQKMTPDGSKVFPDTGIIVSDANFLVLYRQSPLMVRVERL
ncbi:MAG: hypothetical protein H8D42_04850 [Candidatus Marinimicrobia bacterium]|nr:hypothetical protein [Candidatus Neomarinimicrobiota bacterium]